MRRRFLPNEPTGTRSYAAAVFLHALGHPVDHLRTVGGSRDIRFIFPTSASRDIERYYAAKTAIDALIERTISPNLEETPNHGPIVQ